MRTIEKDAFISASSSEHKLHLNISLRYIQRGAVEGGLPTYKIVKNQFTSQNNRLAWLCSLEYCQMATYTFPF